MKPSGVNDILPVVNKWVSITFDTKRGKRLTIEGMMIAPNRDSACVRIIIGIYINFDGTPIARVYCIKVDKIFDITLSSS